MGQIAAETAKRGTNPRNGQTIWSDGSEVRAAQSPWRGRRTGPTEPPAYGCGRRGSEAPWAEEVEAGGEPHGAPPTGDGGDLRPADSAREEEE